MGVIWVESAGPDRGSTFTFAIPILEKNKPIHLDMDYHLEGNREIEMAF
jgi:hypothetical protein